MDNINTRFIQIDSKRLSPSFISSFTWNVFSKIGSVFLNRPPPIVDNNIQLLNLGCGLVHHPGFVNADFYRLHNIFINRERAPDWMIDLTRGLNCRDNYWDGIFLEHVNEHLTYEQNLKLLEECFRILKPGGIIRISLPSLEKYLDWDSLRKFEPKMNRYHSLPEALSNLTQCHGHKSIWDFKLLSELLGSLGFISINRSSFRASKLKHLNVDAPSHQWESLYIEAEKPSY